MDRSDTEMIVTLKETPMLIHSLLPRGRALAVIYIYALMLGSLFSVSTGRAQNVSGSKSPATRAVVLEGPTGPNLLQNADFTEGLTGWMPDLRVGKASATAQIVTNVPLPEGVKGKVLQLDIDSIDKEAWHVQVYQLGLTLAEGKPYTLTFWAKADRTRPLWLAAQVDQEDYHNTGLNSHVRVGTAWRKYTLAFTCTQTQAGHDRVGFIVGSALGRVYLADVRLQRGLTPRLLGANLLQNADFRNGAEHWPFQATPPAQATMQFPADATLPPDMTGKVARFQIVQPGAHPWDIAVSQPDLALEAEQTYTFSFWARADRSRPLAVHTDASQAEYYNSGLDIHVPLTTGWKAYSFVFTAADTDHATHQLVFQMGDTVGTLELAGLSLQPGSENSPPSTGATPRQAQTNGTSSLPKPGKTAGASPKSRSETRNPRSHPLIGVWQSFHKDVGLTGKEYQRYRFVFDANGSGSLQVTTVPAEEDAPPKSQQTETFKWQLVEGGPHVAIGSNIYTWTIEKITDKDSTKQKLTLKNYEGKTYILFRQ